MSKNPTFIVIFSVIIIGTIVGVYNHDDGASSPVVDFSSPELSHKRTALVIGYFNTKNRFNLVKILIWSSKRSFVVCKALLCTPGIMVKYAIVHWEKL
jgi:hypothetical protein